MAMVHSQKLAGSSIPIKFVRVDKICYGAGDSFTIEHYDSSFRFQPPVSPFFFGWVLFGGSSSEDDDDTEAA
jgi:hypothetical protein